MELGTLFIVSVTTARMIMPGMPDLSNIPGMKDANMNAPTRTLTMDLSSKKTAGPHATAECAVPEGLKLGPKVDLAIDKPAPVVKSKDGEDAKPEKVEKQKFVFKMYWQCGEKVPEGQPKVMDTDKMMSGMSQKDMAKYQKQYQKQFNDAAARADGSHAYWPHNNSKKIVKDSVTPGLYELKTNYAGGTSITFDNGQDFLAPIDLVGMKGKMDLAEPIKLEWKAVPNATGYLLTAFAGNGNTMVSWTSASDPNVMDIQNRPLSKKEITKYIEDGILLPPDKTNCRIPAGIFKDVGHPMLMVTAFGTDKAQDKDGITTHVIVRSMATVMLASGMEGMDDVEEESDNPEATSTDDNSDEVTNTDEASEEKPQEPAKKESLKDKLKKKLGGLGL